MLITLASAAAAAAATAAGHLALRRWRERRTRRHLRGARRSAIVEAPNHAVVKITGRLGYALQPILAPLTGRRCALYSVVVWRERALIRDVDGVSFYLTDPSGHALVEISDPSRLRLALVNDARFRLGTQQVADRELEAFLRWHGRRARRLLGRSEPIQFEEGVLEEGEEVTVCGVGAWEVDPSPEAWMVGYRDFPRRLRLRPLPDGHIYVSDEPGVLEELPETTANRRRIWPA